MTSDTVKYDSSKLGGLRRAAKAVPKKKKGSLRDRMYALKTGGAFKSKAC